MEIKYLFKVNKEKWDALIKLRGWKHPVTTLARRTGFSKSYCSQAIDGGIPISDGFMLAIIKVAGASPAEIEEWASLFEITQFPARSVAESDRRDNYAKMRGEKAYKDGFFGGVTKEGQIRIKDRAKSLVRLNSPTPIPAIDFYDDAVPRRAQVAYRYGR